jgi:hypothetical protein
MMFDIIDNGSMKKKGFSYVSQWFLFANGRLAVCTLVFLLTAANIVPLASSQMGQTNVLSNPMMLDGHILFAPMNSFTTYLIDRNGTVNCTWSSGYYPGEAVHWLDDGTILRTIKTGLPGYGGAGGGVQKVQQDGTVLWDFRYDTKGNLSHHDAKMLPNGDVLMIAWESKTRAEAIDAGRNPNNISGNVLMPDHVIEVKPTGPSTGEIVWEWHVWDHLIQDYNSSKANYGVVGDHPELVDINFGTFFLSENDWLHTDSIDYNPAYDQILLSVHNFNEIWVIDHSTTTEEAAGHNGGNSGKGGDLLYRWGNPQAYRRGNASDEKFFGQHDATWIKPGCPGVGDILVYNNGLNRPAGLYSTVDEIIPPVNESGGYYLSPGSVYGPMAQTWMYIASPPTSLYSSRFSGAQRLSDGDTLICNGEKGEFFEVTSSGNIVWEYTNQYPSPLINNVFKVEFIPPPPPPKPHVPKLDCSGSLSWTGVHPGATVTGSFHVNNIGDNGSLLNWTVNTSSLTWGVWSFTPDHGRNLTPEAGPLTVNVSVVAPNEKKADFEVYIRVENQNDPTNFDVIPVTLKTPVTNPIYDSPFLHHLFVHFLQHHPGLENLWNFFTQRHIRFSYETNDG